MTNSVDPDQLASSEANWSRSTLFAKAGQIWVQQDNGYDILSAPYILRSLIWVELLEWHVFIPNVLCLSL